VVKKSNFSTRYKTFDDFLKNFKGSDAYKNRIIRLHSKYPNASLSQLRGHHSAREREVSSLKERPLYKWSWGELTRNERVLREKSLCVLGKVRKGQSLSSASREFHIKPQTVIKHTNAFKKINGRWKAKSLDRISRVMSIYEKGQQKWIEIKDSRIASRIGKYNSAVNQFLRTGNEDILKQFIKPFRDSKGDLHFFETDLDKLNEIAESQEEPEFYEIYKI